MNSEPASYNRQRLEEEWRARLAEARRKYERAGAESKSAGIDFTARALPTPDGGTNLVRALRTERSAREEYMRVLRIFTNLILERKPEE